MTRFLIFAGCTAALAWISRASLAAPRSHGFWRFFAWECIVALVLLNAVSLAQWFAEPLSSRQLASWLLLVGSLALVGVSGWQFVARGRPDGTRATDTPLFDFEKTTRLVTTGAYAYIRHPLYGSLLLLAWGVFFKRPSGVAAALTLAATAFLVATAKVEEQENIRYFGEAYRSYLQTTKMFIPFLW